MRGTPTESFWLDLPEPERRLTVAQVSDRLRTLPPPGRVRLLPEASEPRLGAILVPLVEVEGEAALVVTKRAADMQHNSGDWVFPGGRFDPGADPDTAATALREASEELGFSPDRLNLAGRLSTYGPIHSGYLLDVYVGVAHVGDISADPREVADVAILPISRLTAKANYRETREMPVVNSGPRAAGALRWERDRDQIYRLFTIREGEILWGLQGLILHEFLSGVFQ